MSILFQNIPQLQNRYPDNQWEEILGGCDFSIFLGCNDMTTATYYSDRTGEITVSVASIRKTIIPYVPLTMYRNIQSQDPLKKAAPSSR